MTECPSPPDREVIDRDFLGPVGNYTAVKKPICRTFVPWPTRAIFLAGRSIRTTYTVGANHGGGHCQWALSYDNGRTAVVIKTKLNDCLKDTTPGVEHVIWVPIPEDAPSGDATLIWLWNNAAGSERDLYASCSDIVIKGKKKNGYITGPIPLYANYGLDSVHIPEFGEKGQDPMIEVFNKRLVRVLYGE
ncbi:hypothetical protein BGZ94_008521 [Podila epigama]|nr:hypothetical protein BGZ94_008521 [Podila epigama]